MLYHQQQKLTNSTRPYPTVENPIHPNYAGHLEEQAEQTANPCRYYHAAPGRWVGVCAWFRSVNPNLRLSHIRNTTETRGIWVTWHRRGSGGKFTSHITIVSLWGFAARPNMWRFDRWADFRCLSRFRCPHVTMGVLIRRSGCSYKGDIMLIALLPRFYPWRDYYPSSYMHANSHTWLSDLPAGGY